MKELIKQVLREETRDLEYIDNYWREMSINLDNIIKRIKTELPIINSNEPKQVPDSKLKTIQYSDMYKWSSSNKSDSLVALADKIIHMIKTGKSDGIKRMLEKIATGRIKSLSTPDRRLGAEFLGRGHFRWNYQAYKLTPEEVERVKEYFKL
jgi:hypothetical protein